MGMEHHIVESLNELLLELPTRTEERNSTLALRRSLRKFLEIIGDRPQIRKSEILMAWQEKPGKPLFNEVGKLVRSFTDQMKAIRNDIPARLGHIARHDMDHASQRLNHIVEMTEQAANATIDLAERNIADMERCIKANREAANRIDAALGQQGLTPEGRAALEDAKRVFVETEGTASATRESLTDILTSQSYQDLTGQIIHKVVDLLTTLETELISLVETFGQVFVPQKNKEGVELEGPQQKEEESRHSQEDVDNLLDSLGF